MADNIGYEIDFIPVGDGERSGDAIAVRYGSPGAYRVMVVDGGNKESGERLVEHIRTCYRTNHVDYLVNTHPDSDHASGLEVVLENLTVGEAWVHRPWNYPSKIIHWLKDGRITVDSLRDRLQDALCHAYRVEELAKEKGVPVYEPFQGARIGDFFVLSPSREWYLDTIAHFNKTPTAKSPPLMGGGLATKAFAIAEKVRTFLDERWDLETLKDGEETSYDNESSVILYAYLSGRGILLTGDAGVQALTHAANYLEFFNINIPSSISFIQVPHHGSRHNVGPTILNRLLGPRPLVPSIPTKTAFVSAGATSSTHPRKSVTNAFKRRGATVIAAKGVSIRHQYNMGIRDNWGAAEEVPFYYKVES
jgi:beta-lactamase superfamily II metal-dependent hydrolase